MPSVMPKMEMFQENQMGKSPAGVP